MFSVKLAPLALLFLTNRTSQLSTLLGNFVHYCKKLYNTLFCSDKNEPPANVLVENMIAPDHVLCCVPPILESVYCILKFLENYMSYVPKLEAKYDAETGILPGKTLANLKSSTLCSD